MPTKAQILKRKAKGIFGNIRGRPEFQGFGTMQVYRSIAHATGLTYPPPDWPSRLNMFDAYLSGGKATGIITQRSASRKKKQTRRSAPRNYAEFNAFYQTKEWQQLRYKVFTLYGKKCACCESIAGPFHVDHIKPRSKFPALELSISNLQVLCEACNMGKGGWDQTDWRESDGDLTPDQAAHMREILQ